MWNRGEMETLLALFRGELGVNKAIAAGSGAVLLALHHSAACLRSELSPAGTSSFINKYLPGVYDVPGTVLTSEDTMVMKSRIVTL